MKEILVIDGQGGGIGKMLVAQLKKQDIEARVTAVGTNALATAAMLKAGADRSATGENSVVVLSRQADIIAGPIGIVMADAMLGEVTPKIAQAVGDAPAKKVLIPVAKCNTYVTLSGSGTLGDHLADAARRIAEIVEEEL